MIDYFTPVRPLPLRHPARFLSTVGGVGHIPIMPGTLGSAVAVPAAWGILHLGGIWGHGALFAAAVLVFFIGVVTSGIYGRRTQKHDPKEVVIDEVAGQWLALVFAQPQHIWQFVLGFLLFRFFDITKIWPANLAQRAIPGGWGVMMDDIVAGIWSCILMYAAVVAYEDPAVATYIRETIDAIRKDYF